jgi:hypothetical protein
VTRVRKKKKHNEGKTSNHAMFTHVLLSDGMVDDDGV